MLWGTPMTLETSTCFGKYLLNPPKIPKFEALAVSWSILPMSRHFESRNILGHAIRLLVQLAGFGLRHGGLVEDVDTLAWAFV